MKMSLKIKIEIRGGGRNKTEKIDRQIDRQNGEENVGNLKKMIQES